MEAIRRYNETISEQWYLRSPSSLKNRLNLDLCAHPSLLHDPAEVQMRDPSR
jgi:hypothetical protein